MILVVLGTQDKTFERLLKAVDKEIEKKTIKERVVVQAGQTKYESKNMEIFDFVSSPAFDKLLDEADLVITHGGAGTILTAIKKGKRIIAAARCAKYGEHHNDHQKQIIQEFAEQGYLLELRDFNKLGSMIEKAKTFKPKKFESNTKNMIKLIENYIEDTNHTAWLHKYKNKLFLGLCCLIVNITIFTLLNNYTNAYLSTFLSDIITIFLSFILNKEKKGKILLVSYLLDIGIMYVSLSYLKTTASLTKILSDIIIIILYGIMRKVWNVKK